MGYNKADIDDLIADCKKGNSRAQFKLYNRYCNSMFNTAYRIVFDKQEAENIMQDAFLSAFTKLDKYKSEFSFGTWLKRIVINKSISHLRSKKNHNQLFDSTAIYLDDRMQENVEDYANTGVKQIIENMKRLNDSYRTVLSLNLIEGYNYEEISEILGISNQNSRTIASRAKAKLRQLIIQNK